MDDEGAGSVNLQKPSNVFGESQRAASNAPSPLVAAGPAFVPLASGRWSLGVAGPHRSQQNWAGPAQTRGHHLAPASRPGQASLSSEKGRPSWPPSSRLKQTGRQGSPTAGGGGSGDGRDRGDTLKVSRRSRGGQSVARPGGRGAWGARLLTVVPAPCLTLPLLCLHPEGPSLGAWGPYPAPCRRGLHGGSEMSTPRGCPPTLWRGRPLLALRHPQGPRSRRRGHRIQVGAGTSGSRKAWGPTLN